MPGLGGSPGEGNGNPLQHSCLGNPMDRGAWRATVHEVPKSQAGLNSKQKKLKKIQLHRYHAALSMKTIQAQESAFYLRVPGTSFLHYSQGTITSTEIHKLRAGFQAVPGRGVSGGNGTLVSAELVTFTWPSFFLFNLYCYHCRFF